MTEELNWERRRQQVLRDWSRMMGACADDMRSTVAIYGRQNDVLHKNRTGVLFAVGQRHFILSAAHELQGYARYGIPLYTAPTTPGGCPVPLGVTIRGNEALDIAVMELREEVVSQLVPRRKFLRMTDVDLLCETPKGFYVVVGYPNSSEYNQTDSAQRRVVTNPLQFGALPFEGEPEAELGYDPANNIILNHANHGFDGSRETRRAPKMTGMSGCGIWRLTRFDRGTPETWRPEDRKLIGIETSCKDGSFVKGTWILHVLRLIANDFPDCKRAMQLTL